MTSECTHNSDCSNRGSCVQYICICDSYITGYHCEITFAQILGVGFSVWRFTFMVMFLLLTLFVGFQIYFILKEGSIEKLRGTSYIMCLLAVLFRFLYFAMDPMGQVNDFPYYLEQLIFGMGFFFGIGCYYVIVLYWASMYHGQAKAGKALVKTAKKVFFVIASLLFAEEFSRRTLFGLRIITQQGGVIFLVFNSIQVLSIMGLAVGMSIYGTLVYTKLKRASLSFRTDMLSIKKLTKKVVLISISLSIVSIVTLLYTFIEASWGPVRSSYLLWVMDLRLC